MAALLNERSLLNEFPLLDEHPLLNEFPLKRVIGLSAAMLILSMCNTLADGTMDGAGGSIAGGAGCCGRSALGGGLGSVAGSRVAWDRVRGGAGESVSCHSTEGQ